MSLSESSDLTKGRLPSGRSSEYQPNLTILLPVHNEAETIGQVLEGFYRDVALPTGAELLVCEDGSTDGTNEILLELSEKYPMRFIAGGTRKGYGGAVRDGLDRVETPFVFFADSDGQYSPGDFWRLWSYMTDYDMVIGHKVDREEPMHRIVLSKGFHVLAKALTGVPFNDMDCGFRVMRQTVAEEVLPVVNSLPFSFWAEFTIIAHHKGFRILEVPVSHRPRMQGTTTIYTPERIPTIVGRQILGLTTLSRRLRAMPRKI